MDTYFTNERTDLKHCNAQSISDCGLTQKGVENLAGNPAGTSVKDEKNPHYHGKVQVKNGKVQISMTYVLTGHLERAKAGLNNIHTMYRNAGFEMSFTPSVQKPDLRIHGTNLAELAQGLKLCDCETALMIGGWAPSYKHFKWGNAVLLNPHSPKNTWAMTDAHEFAHKLGLKHRIDGGITDYPPKRGRDFRKFIESDKKRIIALYQ